MECSGAKELVDRWEGGGGVSLAEYEAMSSHLLECEQCRVRYSVIVGLLGRDVGIADAIPRGRTPSPQGFAAGVMQRLDADTGVHRWRTPRPVATRFAVLAAAALLIVVGVTFYPRLSGENRGEMIVHFVLDAPGATQVSLVGNFTDWNPDRLQLKQEGSSSRWEISVPLKKGETYLYNFVINGSTWIADPTKQVKVSDGFGGESSLIQL